MSDDVISPTNITTPNLGLNKPLVGGDDDIWGGLLNQNADLLDTAVNNLRTEVQSLSGALLFIGTYDVVADFAEFAAASGFPNGALPPASPANFNSYLIATTAGTGHGNAPAVAFNKGDWLVSDGAEWVHLALGIPPGGGVAASTVTVTPAVQGATNVQSALQQLDTAQGNFLPLAGGTMAGPLRTALGNTSAPGLEIGGADAGLWRLSATIFVNAGATTIMQWASTGITSAVPVTLPADPIAPLQAATAQYVDNKAATVAPLMDGAAAVGTGATFSRVDHVHPSDTSRAPLASPTFTGDPKAPTAAPGDNDTSIATTAFVQTAIGSGFAPIASPVFTGDPRAPTPTAGDNDTSVATTAFVSAAVGTANHNVGRNLIHNPLFAVAQRGAGAFTANGTYTLDRWAMSFANGSMSVSQVVLTDADRAAIGDEAATAAMQVVFTGGAPAASATNMQHGIEDIRRLGNKTVTLSFWAKAAAGTPKLGADILQYFGTGGSPSAQVSGAGQSVTIATTWARYSLTFAVPSVAGKTLGTNSDHQNILLLWFSSGTTNNGFAGGIGVQSGTFQIWGVQFEIGSVATPLDKPYDYGADLRNCQRFYQTGLLYTGAYGIAATGASLTTYIVAMRAVPTVAALGANSSANVGALSFGAAGYNAIFVSAQVTGTGGYVINTNFVASADL